MIFSPGIWTLSFNFFLLEKQTYQAQKVSKSKRDKIKDLREESEPETVYVNIWNTENGKLELSQQNTMPSQLLGNLEDEKEDQTGQDTPFKLLWSPQYSVPVGGVGDSNRAEPSSTALKSLYQNIDDNQELFQFVSNPKVSFVCLFSSYFREGFN